MTKHADPSQCLSLTSISWVERFRTLQCNTGMVGAVSDLGYKWLTLNNDHEPAIFMLKDDVSACLPVVECVSKSFQGSTSGRQPVKRSSRERRQKP